MPERDSRLRELAFGKYEGGYAEELFTAIAPGLGYADAGALYANLDSLSVDDYIDAVAAQSADTEFPVETAAEFKARAFGALEDAARAQSEAGGGDVLVVSSGLTIIAILDELGISESHIDNASVTKLRFDNGEWTAETVNDLSYVEAGASH